MSVVYWGGSVSGKLHIEMLYRYNYKSLFKKNTFHIHYKKSQKDGKGSFLDDEVYDVDGMISKKITIFRDHEEYYSDWIKPATSGVGRDFLYSVNEDKKLLFSEKYSPESKKLFRSHLIKHFPHWSQADVYTHCMDLIGLSNLSKRFKLIKSIDNVKIYDDIIIDELRTRKHIVPYKSNMREHMLYFMLWVAHNRRAEPNIKSAIWMIKYHRLVEQALEKYGFDVTYFDIDTDDYAETFSVDKNISRSYTKTQLRDDAPIDKVYDMIDRYIEKHNIKDIRLQNSQYDNILFQ
tara:strand:+ start:6566 stop:7441 length:876 start_codon:yes stop_codon:yes gene_type:complete